MPGEGKLTWQKRNREAVFGPTGAGEELKTNEKTHNPFANPILKVNIATGEKLIDRMDQVLRGLVRRAELEEDKQVNHGFAPNI